MAYKFLILLSLSISITTTILFSPPVYGQITAPCTPSMITSFSPCMNFVTNSYNNSSGLNGTTTPPADCCNSLNSLMTNGKECLCLIATGTVPFPIPNINRTLAISLPRSCKIPGVPLQCKAARAASPSISPNVAPSPSVQELAPPEPLSPSSSPGADATPTPPDATTTGGPPTSNTGSRAGLAPSAAQPSYIVSHLHLIMAVVGAVALKYY